MNREPKRRLTFQDLPINVEIEAGDVKTGTDDQGQPWAHRYQFPYGEIAGTVGADGDPVDVYLGPHLAAPRAYVVHQNHRDGTFDEDKVFLGFLSAADAEKAYRDHGPAFGFGRLEELALDAFRNDYLAARRLAATDGYDSADRREEFGTQRYGR